jgi:hypothetical protein
MRLSIPKTGVFAAAFGLIASQRRFELLNKIFAIARAKYGIFLAKTSQIGYITGEMSKIMHHSKQYRAEIIVLAILIVVKSSGPKQQQKPQFRASTLQGRLNLLFSV